MSFATLNVIHCKSICILSSTSSVLTECMVQGGLVFMLKVQKFSNDVFALYFPTITWSLVRILVRCFVNIFLTFCQQCMSTVLYCTFLLLLLVFYYLSLSYGVTWWHKSRALDLCLHWH